MAFVPTIIRANSMIRNIWRMPSCLSPISQPLAGWLVAEGHLAGVGDLQAHLVLDVGGVDAVALAQLAGLPVEVVLRDEEEGQALGAGAVALGAGEHVVDDVLGHVVLTGGDEALHALDVPGAVLLLDRPWCGRRRRPSRRPAR